MARGKKKLINIRFKPLPLPASSLGFPSEQTKINYFQFMDVKILIKMSSNEETLRQTGKY